MRVVSGSARGRRLKALEGTDTRPTTDKVKEAVFSMLTGRIEGAYALDLFAGSGGLGIEALSRGAAQCLFVERSPKAAAVVQENLQLTGLAENAILRRTDALSYLRTATEVFDIVFVDPPYDAGLYAPAFALLAPRLAVGGIIVAEHRTDIALTPPDSLSVRTEKRYGTVAITVLEKI